MLRSLFASERSGVVKTFRWQTLDGHRPRQIRTRVPLLRDNLFVRQWNRDSTFGRRGYRNCPFHRCRSVRAIPRGTLDARRTDSQSTRHRNLHYFLTIFPLQSRVQQLIPKLAQRTARQFNASNKLSSTISRSAVSANMVFTQGRGFVLGDSFGLPHRSL